MPPHKFCYKTKKAIKVPLFPAGNFSLLGVLKYRCNLALQDLRQLACGP
jgi:hypothetical protein